MCEFIPARADGFFYCIYRIILQEGELLSLEEEEEKMSRHVRK